MSSKIRTYEGDDVIVEFDAKRCIHAEECVHGLPSVFDTNHRPWIDPSQSDASSIVSVIQKCPTGALRYRRRDGGADESPEEETTVRIAADGPLYVTGRIRLGLPDGSTANDSRVAVCRCGASKNKPYCDNSHLEAGFKDSGRIGASGMPAADGTEAPGVQLTPAPNGPVILSGAVTIVGTNGQSAAGAKGALCRCGASQNKPFCDGAHEAAGFEAD